MASTSNSETSSKKMVLCGHCNDYVAKRTYYQHRRLYFDTRSREWSDKRVFNHVDVEVPFNLEHRQSSLHSPSLLSTGMDNEQLNEGISIATCITNIACTLGRPASQLLLEVSVGTPPHLSLDLLFSGGTGRSILSLLWLCIDVGRLGGQVTAVLGLFHNNYSQAVS